jgi:hypothetical protein
VVHYDRTHEPQALDVCAIGEGMNPAFPTASDAFSVHEAATSLRRDDVVYVAAGDRDSDHCRFRYTGH